MKKMLFVMLAMILFVACNRVVEAYSSSEVTQPITRGFSVEQIAEGDADHQLQANNLCAQLLMAIGVEDGDRTIYPDYYGGAYAEKNGQLVILTKGDMSTGKKHIQQVIGVSPLVEYRRCRYSYQELTDICRTISRVFPSLPKTDQDNLCTYSIDDRWFFFHKS